MACYKFRHLSKIIVCFFESRRVLLKEVFCQSAINHLKFLEINETKGSKTSTSKSSAIVKLQVYTNSSLKN